MGRLWLEVESGAGAAKKGLTLWLIKVSVVLGV